MVKWWIFGFNGGPFYQQVGEDVKKTSMSSYEFITIMYANQVYVLTISCKPPELTSTNIRPSPWVGEAPFTFKQTFYGWKFFGANGPIFIHKNGPCTVIHKNKHSHSHWCPTLFSTKIQPSRSSAPPYMDRSPVPCLLMVSRKAMRGGGSFSGLGSNPGTLAVDQKLAGTLWESWDPQVFSRHLRRKVWWALRTSWCLHVLWLEMSLMASHFAALKPLRNQWLQALCVWSCTCTVAPVTHAYAYWCLLIVNWFPDSNTLLSCTVWITLQLQKQKPKVKPPTKFQTHCIPILVNLYGLCQYFRPFASVHAPGLTWHHINTYLITNTYYNFK